MSVYCKSCGCCPITMVGTVCSDCKHMLHKAIKRARLRRDTYDLAVSEWRKWDDGKRKDQSQQAVIQRAMHDAGFRTTTLTQIGLGY